MERIDLMADCWVMWVSFGAPMCTGSAYHCDGIGGVRWIEGYQEKIEDGRRCAGA